MSSAPVRTRFAPSPTGYMHVGGVRTALFAWLVARQGNGQFILRIEDTDRTRHVQESEQHIIDCLVWLGLTPDEGPLRQSQRLDIYKHWTEKLVKAGRAYADLTTEQQLNELRAKAKEQKKPFLFREHRPVNPSPWDGKTALRFKSEPKAYKWHDEVMGDLSSGPEAIDDFIILKSDGAKDILDYRREGYLPEALINFLATLGWNDGTEQEIFSVDELIKKFNLSRVHHGGARFDEQRLLWMNGHYIRQLSVEELYQKAKDFWPKEAKEAEDYKKAVLALVQERLKYLAELGQLTKFFFVEPDEKAILKLYKNPVDKQLAKNPPNYKAYLEAVIKELSASDFSARDIQNRLNRLLDKLKSKPAVLFPVIRIAISGASVSPEIFGTLAAVGKQKSLDRLKKALGALENSA